MIINANPATTFITTIAFIFGWEAHVELLAPDKH